MPKKPEEIKQKKELVYYYQGQIYKLTRKQKFLESQVVRIKEQVKGYEKELKKLKKWLEG